MAIGFVMQDDPFRMYCFYHGYARYAQWGEWEHVFTASYDESERLRDMTEDLESSDTEALRASKDIDKMVLDGDAYLGHDKDPVLALQKCINAIIKYKAGS